MVRSQTYLGPPGAVGMVIPELANVRILHVEREGIGHEVISSIPATGQAAVWYVPSSGRLIFDVNNPFNTPGAGAPTDIEQLEKIYVLWQD